MAKILVPVIGLAGVRKVSDCFACGRETRHRRSFEQRFWYGNATWAGQKTRDQIMRECQDAIDAWLHEDPEWCSVCTKAIAKFNAAMVGMTFIVSPFPPGTHRMMTIRGLEGLQHQVCKVAEEAALTVASTFGLTPVLYGDAFIDVTIESPKGSDIPAREARFLATPADGGFAFTARRVPRRVVAP